MTNFSQGLLGNPLFNLGIGLLSAPGTEGIQQGFKNIQQGALNQQKSDLANRKARLDEIKLQLALRDAQRGPAASSTVGKILGDLQAARESGDEQGAAFLEQALMKASTHAPATSVTVNAGDKERTVLSERRRGKFIEKNFERAEGASSILMDAQSISNNLRNLAARGDTTGALSPIVTLFNNAGAQAGLDVDLDATSSLELITSAANKLAIPMTKQLGVNPTDKDYNAIVSTIASAGKTMESNFALVDIMEQAAKRNLALSDVITAAIEDGEGEVGLRKIERQFKKDNPLQLTKPLPKDKSKVRKGVRYRDAEGVYLFDGERMIQVR